MADSMQEWRVVAEIEVAAAFAAGVRLAERITQWW
jgi:hypothetical protein